MWLCAYGRGALPVPRVRSCVLLSCVCILRAQGRPEAGRDTCGRQAYERVGRHRLPGRGSRFRFPVSALYVFAVGDLVFHCMPLSALAYRVSVIRPYPCFVRRLSCLPLCATYVCVCVLMMMSFQRHGAVGTGAVVLLR